jgi:two-component system, cell cycle sensor histidine kinase and response regulator CckA
MSGIHVLVVDDDPAVGKVVSGLLRRAGYSVSSAGTAEEALRIAREGRVDLLVSDVVLGRVDGLEVEEQVRTLQPGLKTIFMSGYARPRYGSGSDDPVLVKPFEPEDLLSRVSALVG